METKTLKRYTNLASLISILKNKELTLLDPSKWEDKNDSHYLWRYAEKKRVESIFALCFTSESETSHHWKTFSHGSDGVCIKIHSEPFKKHIDSLGGILHGEVKYKLIEEIESQTFTVDELPFLKRYPFRDEAEYRVLLTKTASSKFKTYSIEFDTSLISSVTLSNSLPKPLQAPIVDLIRSIEGCSNLRITRSTLNENSRWKKACERAVLVNI